MSSKQRTQLSIDIEKAKKIVPPTQYNKFLQYLELKDIYLNDVKSKLFSKDFTTNPSYDFIEKTKLISRVGDNTLIEVEYELKTKSGKKRLFEIKIKYIVAFEADSEIPDEFFHLYNVYSLPLQTFPYLREFVNTLISRMGIPPLILPLRKFLIS